MPETHHSLCLPNGLTLVAEQVPFVRSVSFQFLVPAGAVTDPEGREGSGTVLEGLCYRGAGSRNSRELSDALDALGLQRSGAAELEYATFGGALLAEDLDAALALYADLLRRPHLADEQFPAELDLARQKLRRLEDSPAEKLFVNLRRTYYTNEYGRTALGSKEGLAAITPETIREDHARRYRPGGTILAVAGLVDWEALCDTVHRTFGDWEHAAPDAPDPDTTGREAYRHLEQETNQEQIGIAYPSVPVGHPHYYPMRLALEVLSGGMAARLETEVREKRGLVYSVRAMPLLLRRAGAVVVYAGTTPERCQETLDVTLAELKRLEEGVTPEELARARTGVLAALVMQSEATRARAHSLARDQYLLGHVRSLDEIRAEIEAVTPDRILEYLRGHPARDFTVVTLGPRALEVSP